MHWAAIYVRAVSSLPSAGEAKTNPLLSRSPARPFAIPIPMIQRTSETRTETHTYADVSSLSFPSRRSGDVGGPHARGQQEDLPPRGVGG